MDLGLPSWTYGSPPGPMAFFVRRCPSVRPSIHRTRPDCPSVHPLDQTGLSVCPSDQTGPDLHYFVCELAPFCVSTRLIGDHHFVCDLTCILTYIHTYQPTYMHMHQQLCIMRRMQCDCPQFILAEALCFIIHGSATGNASGAH